LTETQPEQNPKMADVQLALDFADGKLPVADLAAQFTSKG
jgi:hypothetical protein